MRRRRRTRARARRARTLRVTTLVLRVLAIPAVRIGLAAFTAYVLVLNAIVRYAGHGDASLVSVWHLGDKSYAVAALGLHSLTHLWSSHDDDPRPLVVRAALEQGVPVSLALAVARTESGLRPHCISATGAMGLMQLMPATALAFGVLDPYDPLDNARGAASLLRELSQRYRGDRARIAAAYNAGSGRVPRSGSLEGLPAETQLYVSRVVGRARLTQPGQ